MDWLKEIQIKNFKSWKDATLQLHQGINVIYGNPQAGKSNIFRALELLMDNLPRGGGFLPNFLDKGETEVSIRDCNDIEIGIKTVSHRMKKNREKKKRDSTYYYIKDHTKEELWDSSGVGSSVPAEIKEALNLNEVNLQFQKDPPFLATKSGSKISKTINRITGLDVGDRAISFLNTKVNQQNAVVEGIKTELNDLKTKKKFFTNIKDLQTTIKKVRSLTQQIDKFESRASRLSTLLTDIYHLERVVKNMSIPEGLEAKLKRVDELDSKIFDAERKVAGIKRAVNRIDNLELEVKVNTVPDVEDLINEVEILDTQIEMELNKVHSCKVALDRKAKYTGLKTDLNNALGRYLTTIKKFKVCPTCFTKIGEGQLKEIERRLTQ